MSILDVIVIVGLIIGIIIGYKEGAISSILHMIGTLIMFILAFYLKGPLSMVLFEHFPFNIQSGIFAGISSFNFLVYETIAFFILIIVLSIILKVVLKVSGILNKLINKTIILALPNKIIGAFFGALRFFIFGFFVLFFCTFIPQTSKYIKESKVSLAILNNTPILTSVTKDFNNTMKDIYVLIDKYDDDSEDTMKKIDYDVLEILLKHNIISVDTVEKMQKSNKINIENIDELLSKYSK